MTSINTSATDGCTLASCTLDGIANPRLYYDADGNMTCVTTKASCDQTAARTYTWTSFDMAASIATGAKTTSFGYTPEHQRGVLTSTNVTLFYYNDPAGGVTSELVPGATSAWRDYLAPYGHIVAELFASGGVTTPYYFVEDQEFSTTALANASGGLREYDSYDAWGKRRNASGSDDTGCLIMNPSLTLRGYTGQEMLDSYCLVNLNARLYDPALGRVLSADPTVPDAMDGQTYNRYSYVENNPLAFTDPSGYTTCVVHNNCNQINCITGGCGMPNWGLNVEIISSGFTGDQYQLPGAQFQGYVANGLLSGYWVYTSVGVQEDGSPTEVAGLF